MEKIAFITGNTFIYWSSILLTLGIAAAIAFFAALYLAKGGSFITLSVTVPTALAVSAVLARLVHWYCREDSYESFAAAMTDYTWGGYALMGAFAGCILTACLLRLLRVVKNLPQMFDCMAVASGVGIAVGRLASFFNTSDRGLVVPDGWGLPIAYPVTNSVSGVVENRLATFLLQSISAATISVALAVYMLVCACRKKKLRDGDVCLLFLTAYSATQILLDSTRYDSLFMRSNGFVSIVQILGAVALVTAAVIFSVRMVRNRGLKFYSFVLWFAALAALTLAGFMEYYVQRHGNEAALAYSGMGAALVVMVGVMLIIRYLAERPPHRAKA